MGEDEAARLAHLEGILHALDGAVWEFDWRTGTFTWVSDGCERLLGYPRTDWLLPDFWVDHLHPDDRDEAVSYCRAATSEGRDHQFEYRMIHSDGSSRWVRDIVSVDPVLRTEGLLRGVLIDVTDTHQAEDRYRRQAEEFDAVFRLMRDLYFRIDSNGVVADYRAPSQEELYAPPEVFLGKRLEEILPPDAASILRVESDRCRATGMMTVAEYQLPQFGIERSWEARFLPLENDSIAVVVRDITRLRERERELREQRDFLDLLLDTLDSGVIVVKGGDPPIVQLANRPAARLIGYEPDELIGNSTRVFHPTEDEWRAFLERTSGIVAADNSASLETRMQHRSGRLFDAEVSVRGLGMEGADRIGIIRDVSDRKAAERMVRESEMRFRNIVEEAPFGLHLYELRDEELVLTAANEAADRILRISHGPLIGLTLDAAFPASVEAGWPAVYRRIATEGGSWTAEIPYDDGSIAGVFETTVFQTSPGRVAVAFVDITERRAIEESDRLHREKVSAMASELASAEDRERRRLAEELHDRVSQALAVTRMHLAAAVDDHGRFDVTEFESAVHMLEDSIKEVRAVTTELYPPVLHELGIGPALRWLAEEFESKHGLKCTVTVADGDAESGEEVRNIIFRAARELLMNVVKHAGTHRAWVSLDRLSNTAVLTVADQGCGMAASVNGNGGGFGLFSLRERLSHMAGSIEVESSPGAGTRVTITVPVVAL